MAGEVNLMLLIFAIALPHQEATSNTKSCQQPGKYLISNESMTWEDADKYCTDEDGFMVELLYPDFADKAKIFISNSQVKMPIWLGGKSEVGDFIYKRTKQTVVYSTNGTLNTSCLLVKFEENGLQYIPQSITKDTEQCYICRKSVGEINVKNIYISNNTANLYHARNICAKMFNNTGDLFYLKSYESLDKLSNLNLINSSKLYYTGACRLVWYWTESSNSIIYANWTSEQPNATSSSCLVYLPDGTLDDVNCNQKYQAFCVKDEASKTKCGNDAINGENTTEGFDDAITTEAPTTKNVSLWIGVGVGVSAGVALVILVIVVILCCRKKCCGKKKPKENQNQFNYLSNTLETKSSHIYTTDPTYQADTVRGTNGVFGVYDTIDNLAPEGSTNNVSLTPDVTMRQTPANQNAVLRKDIYSQVVKKKNQNAEANLSKHGVQHVDVLELDEPDSNNDDHEIIENDVYNFN